MDQEEPLFAESRKESIIQLTVGTLVLLFAGLTVIFSLVNGIRKSANHVLMGVSIAIYAYILYTLIKWYRLGEMEPRFKYIINGLALAITLLCICANIYIWGNGSFVEAVKI